MGTVVSVLRNGNEYVFEYGGYPETYNRYLPVGEQMVNSIGITEYGEGEDTGSGDFGQNEGQGQGFGQNEGQGQGFGQNEGQGQGFGQVSRSR